MSSFFLTNPTSFKNTSINMFFLGVKRSMIIKLESGQAVKIRNTSCAHLHLWLKNIFFLFTKCFFLNTVTTWVGKINTLSILLLNLPNNYLKSSCPRIRFNLPLWCTNNFKNQIKFPSVALKITFLFLELCLLWSQPWLKIVCKNLQHGGIIKNSLRNMLLWRHNSVRMVNLPENLVF